MALIQNITVYNHQRLRLSAYHGTNERTQWGPSMANTFSRSASLAGMTKLNAFPNGYNPDYTWIPPITAGFMSVAGGVIIGTGATGTVNLAGGKNGAATLEGVGSIDADIIAKANLSVTITGTGEVSSTSVLAGAVDMQATITGTGEISDADLRLIAELIATIAGQATVTGALNAVVGIQATLTGEGLVYSANLAGGQYMQGTIAGAATVGADIIAKGWMSATIEIGASPSAADIAYAIWGAIAAGNNTPGTMGEKVNDAGSAANPWTENLPGSYVEGQAGYILGTYLDAKVSEAGGGGLTEGEIAAAVWADSKALTVAKYLGLS